MPSLTVDLNPSTTYKIRLEAGGYKTLEFNYTTRATASTVTKTLTPCTVTCDLDDCPNTINVKTGCDLLKHYDTDNDGVISQSELLKASNDLSVYGKITKPEMDFIADCWKKGSINAKCPGCYTPTPPAKYEFKMELFYPATLLDKHEVAPDAFVIAKFYARNTGNVRAAAFGRFYLDGVKLREYTSWDVGVGTRDILYLPISSATPGKHAVKAEVGPSGKSVTDTMTDSFTVVAAMGTLSVSSSPTGASGTLTPPPGLAPPPVFFTTPFSVKLHAGTYGLKITKTGYKPITDSAIIEAGKTTTKNYTLTLITKVKVTVSANVRAKLFVNGVLKGTLS